MAIRAKQAETGSPRRAKPSRETYNASQLKALKGLEPVRQVPGMYIGSTDEVGLQRMLREIVDNSIDEAMAEYCTQVVVTLHADGSASVLDNGRGIPVDINPVEKMSGLQMVMTLLHGGGKFKQEGSAYRVSGGMHGVGASVVNALSTRMVAEVSRDKKLYRQEYLKGVPTGDVAVVGKSHSTGTLVRFWPDPEVFSVTEFNQHSVIEWLRQAAYLNGGIAIQLIDERDGHQVSFYYEGGVPSMVRHLNADKKTTCRLFSVEKTVEATQIEIALQYQNTTFSETLLSFVNNINTTDGGAHVTGFRSALTNTLNRYGKKVGILKEADGNLSGEDVRDGLTAVISVRMAQPLFESQSKTKFNSPEVTGRVSSVFGEAFWLFLEKSPQEAKKIIEQCTLAQRARTAALRQRDLVQRKSLLEDSTLPGKLSDCSERDPAECEIYIVEGDSAGGTAKTGRDRRFQAILPLKGKILNVEKARMDKMLGNEEIKNLITAMGVGFGRTLDISKLKYHRVVLMADADVDGSHIRTLLLTFFWRHLQPVIEGGYLYLAQPPLYKIEKGTGKALQMEYAFTDTEKDQKVKRMGEGKCSVSRYKGLGEMSADQLWETTMNPATRTLVQMTVDDAIRADEIFDKLMGPDVAPRKRFIQTHAKTVRNLDI